MRGKSKKYLFTTFPFKPIGCANSKYFIAPFNKCGLQYISTFHGMNERFLYFSFLLRDCNSINSFISKHSNDFSSRIRVLKLDYF